MIESISARNFLCFDDTGQQADLAPLTVLVGPNNSGKSTIISGFNLLRESILRGGNVRWMTESYNLGDFAAAVNDHDLERRIELATTVRNDERPLRISATIEPGDRATWSYVPSAPAGPNVLKSAWYFKATRNEIPRWRSTNEENILPIWGQPLAPDGSNIVTYLLERWTDQDEQWPVAQEWLKKIDPELSILKSPLRSNLASLETTNKFSKVSVNLAYQGTGIQKALAIVSGVIFSPSGSTIIVEEPEVHLNRGSIEALVDLFNYAVNNLKKQIILSTHSLDLLLQYASDVGMGSPRGATHVAINPAKFKLLGFERVKGTAMIKEYTMKERFSTVMQRVRELLKPEGPVQLPAQTA